jgi:hypothetical protein
MSLWRRAFVGVHLASITKSIQRFCDEYCPAIVHYKTLYMFSLLIPIRAFPSEGRTTWVCRYCNISKGSCAYCTTITSRYVQVRTVNLTSQMTRQARFPMHNVIPHTGRHASSVGEP